MALINPIYAFVVPFLFVVTVPLAVLAGVTTTLAFSVLICRVILVYLDIGLSLVNRSIIGLKVPSHLHQAAARSDSPSPTHSTASLYHHRRRRRRPSSASILSGGSITPVNNNDTGLGLIPSIGAERDFEGVGGWRVGDDDIWTTINSRFELPDRQHVRNHHRSPSGGGPTTPGDGGFLMMKRRTRSPEATAAGASTSRAPTSPNCSRTRTPSASRVSFGSSAFVDGYFPLAMSSKVPGKKQSPQPA